MTKRTLHGRRASLAKWTRAAAGLCAKFVSNRNVDTVDIGVPMLSMHAPFELVAKQDVLMTYRAFLAFATARQ